MLIFHWKGEPVMKRHGLALFVILTLFVAVPSFGSDIESRLKALEETLKSQQKTIEEQKEVINELKKEVNEAKKEAAPQPEEKPVEAKTQKATGLFGASNLANPNISLILDTFGYTSNIEESELENRGIPGYTTEGIENRNGFNLESAELYLFAPVDPYFNLYATIPVTEDGAEVEEAYFLTTSLPYGFQLKGGKFKSGFGRINSQHPHAWDFADIPLPYRAFMGGEGIIEKGAQLTYLPLLDFYTLLGIEVLQGDNDVLFGPDAKSGPHAYTAYAKASFDISDNSTILFGPSVMTGKTKTGSIAEDTEFSGNSTVYDLEFTYKWKPSKLQSIIVQSEYLYRTQHGDLEDTDAATTESLKRTQDGLYIQGIYQINRWRLGARYDILDLFKDDYILAGDNTDFGGRPWRATGMLEFNPTEFSRIRLQYNHDKSARDEKTNNEMLLQLIFGIGAHGAHPF
jgi:cell division protein FtsB